MSIYVFVVFLLVVQTVNGDQPDVEMFSESVNQDAEMILLCRAKSFNTSGIELHIKKNRCDLLTKEDGVKTSGVVQHKDNTYWRRDFVIVSESEMSNYSCEVIHAESRFHVEKVWDPDSGLKGRIISSRPRVFVSVDNKVQAKITLTCLAEGFYPRNITLNIKRNGSILTREDGVETSLDVCPREDNTFQRRDHIIISKSDRSNYSCEVIHAASDSHEEKVWDHHLPPDGFEDKDGDSGHRSAIITAVMAALVVVPFLVVVLVLHLRSVPGAAARQTIQSDTQTQTRLVNLTSLTGDTDFESSASAGSGDSDKDDTSNNVETEKLRKTNVQDQRTPSEPSNPSTSEKTNLSYEYLLNDKDTYETLRRDTTNIYKTRIINYLQQLEKEKAIDRLLYYRLYPGKATPCMYGLPKIHKEGAPLRPIVSSINSVTYNIAKHLASILSPLVGNTPHHIGNSRDFVNKVKDVAAIVSYDVTSLFTCIPTREATDVVRKRLQKDDTLASRTNLTPEQVCV